MQGGFQTSSLSDLEGDSDIPTEKGEQEDKLRQKRRQ